MPHERLDRLQIRTSVDQQGGECVPALMHAALPSPELMLVKVVAEYAQHRNRASTRPGLRLDRALVLVPLTLNMDHAGAEIKV